MNFISKLPHELLIHIYEYNPEHREKMICVLQDICSIQYCDFCNKIIMRYIWSKRRCEMIFCSSECLDNY
jgi:hypothetical protein